MSAAGDYVRCIDARNSDGVLKLGGIYRVASAYGSFVCIEAGRYNGWYASRFVPAPNIDSLRAVLTSTPAGAPAYQGA